MPRRVLVQGPTGSFDLVEQAAPDEHHLQEIVKAHPSLVPSEDLGLDGELLVVGRETSLASGAIDLLCLSRTGELVLIEFKTGPKNPDFRHALAQVIDYGSDLWRMPLDDFDRGVVQRYLTGNHADPAAKGATDLSALIAQSSWDLAKDEKEAVLSRLTEVFETGDFVYVVAAQRFTDSMLASLDYLNHTMRFGRFYLLEVIHLAGRELTAHAARVVAAPPKRSAAGPSSPGSQANEAKFLSRIADGDYREAMQSLFANCAALGFIVSWGSKGASVRVRTPDRNEPLSVAWTFIGNDGWYGARHVTLGVDDSSLAAVPSAAGALKRYLAATQTIRGALPVKSGLNAVTIAPAALPSSLPEVLQALENLQLDLSGETGSEA